MRGARVRQPRVIRQKQHKKQQPKTNASTIPTHIITKQMCRVALIRDKPLSESQLQSQLKLIQPLLQMPQNVRSEESTTLGRTFEMNFCKVNKLFEEWLYRYELNGVGTTVGEALTACKPIRKDFEASPFYNAMYEEFVEVLLYWEDWVKAVKKMHVKEFYERFYNAIHELIDDMDLPYKEKP